MSQLLDKGLFCKIISVVLCLQRHLPNNKRSGAGEKQYSHKLSGIEWMTYFTDSVYVRNYIDTNIIVLWVILRVSNPHDTSCQRFLQLSYTHQTSRWIQKFVSLKSKVQTFVESVFTKTSCHGMFLVVSLS